MINFRENIDFNDPHYFGHILGGHWSDIFLYNAQFWRYCYPSAQPNLGCLSKIPIQKAQISLEIKSYYEILKVAKNLILLIYFTYEVKKLLYYVKLMKKPWN